MGIDAEIVEDTAEEEDIHTYTGAQPVIDYEEVPTEFPINAEGQTQTEYAHIPIVHYERGEETAIEQPKEMTGFALKVTSANKSSGGNTKITQAGGTGPI
jgi:hypothetical protein